MILSMIIHSYIIYVLTTAGGYSDTIADLEEENYPLQKKLAEEAEGRKYFESKLKRRKQTTMEDSKHQLQTTGSVPLPPSQDSGLGKEDMS